MSEQKIHNFPLKSFQARFMTSEFKFPILKSSWGTGKSLCLCGKALELAQKYPNNLILVARKEYTDLRDSTIKDWTLYTGMAPDSGRDVKFPNGSIIMFRHLEELSENNIQNMNLGAFFVEQAEELENSKVFYLLFGRLRRGKSSRQGYLVANARGHNWIYEIGQKGIWVKSQYCTNGHEIVFADKPCHCGAALDPARTTTIRVDDYITADSTMMEDVIPVDTLKTWAMLKDAQPEVYRRFVLNSDNEEDIFSYVIKRSLVELAIDQKIPYHRAPIVSCDPARFGDDETAIYVIDETNHRESLFLRKKSTGEVAAEVVRITLNTGAKVVVIDEIGIGAGVLDRVKELLAGREIHVIGCNAAGNSDIPAAEQEKYENTRAWMYFKAADLFYKNKVGMENDPELVEQLSQQKYEYTKSGKWKLESKDEVKKRIGRSPDRADAFVMALAYADKCPWKESEIPAFMVKQNSMMDSPRRFKY